MVKYVSHEIVGSLILFIDLKFSLCILQYVFYCQEYHRRRHWSGKALSTPPQYIMKRARIFLAFQYFTVIYF